MDGKTSDKSSGPSEHNQQGACGADSCNADGNDTCMAPEADNMEVVLGEDFSKFTAGSEENPDMTNILTSEGVIMQDYISTYGWSGINIYQPEAAASWLTVSRLFL